MSTFPPFDPATHAPQPPAPAGSCDCQVHVFSPDRARYPTSGQHVYEPPAGSMEDAMRMHAALGCSRGVVVQATIYGTDNRLMADSIRGRKNYRGVAIVNDTVDDEELQYLHDCGVRGARFNFAQFLGIVPSADDFRRAVKRIARFGWHVRIHSSADELLDIAPLLHTAADALPLVIDHMAHLKFDRGLLQPPMKTALELLRHPNVWVMLSNGDRSSVMERDWDDAVPFGRAFFEAAPDRSIWCTDWPHVLYRMPMVNDGDLVELMYRFLPDVALRKAVLVDNPARLMDFQDE